jgi:hypothetical protein
MIKTVEKSFDVTGYIEVTDGQETHIWRFAKTPIKHDGKSSDT